MFENGFSPYAAVDSVTIFSIAAKEINTILDPSSDNIKEVGRRAFEMWKNRKQDLDKMLTGHYTEVTIELLFKVEKDYIMVYAVSFLTATSW